MADGFCRLCHGSLRQPGCGRLLSRVHLFRACERGEAKGLQLSRELSRVGVELGGGGLSSFACLDCFRQFLDVFSRIEAWREKARRLPAEVNADDDNNNDNDNDEEGTGVQGDMELEDNKQDIPRLDPDQIAEGLFDVDVVQVKEEEIEVSIDHVTQEEAGGCKRHSEDLRADEGPSPDPVPNPLSNTERDPLRSGTAGEEPTRGQLNPQLPLLQQIAQKIYLAAENPPVSDSLQPPQNSGLRLVGVPLAPSSLPGPIRLVQIQNREVRLAGRQNPAVQTKHLPIRLVQMQNKEVRLVAPGPLTAKGGVVSFQTRPAPQNQNCTRAVDPRSPTGQRTGIRLVPVLALPNEEPGGLVRVNISSEQNPGGRVVTQQGGATQAGSRDSSRGEAAAVGLPNAALHLEEDPSTASVQQANRPRIGGLDLVMAYRNQLPKSATPSTLTPAPAPAPAPAPGVLPSSSVEGSDADEEGRRAKSSYICTHCGNSFSRMSSLHRHQDTLHPRIRAPSYPCPDCGKNFTDSGNLRQHRRIHTGEKPYSCGGCGLRFRFKGNLNSHQCVDEDETPFSCQICGKNFRRPDGLERHVAGAHREPGAGGYECVVCGKRFWNRELLKSHGRVHTVQKPYWCQECGKRFRHLSTFNYHKRTHLREAPHRCDKCGRAFADQEALEGHRKVHRSEAPFRCEVCGNGFRLLSHFRSHQRIHSGETPYDCAECGRSFSHLGALRFHVQNHERGKKEGESENGGAE
ncbi:zinc finger protein 74-like isoform X2 [Polyodon spathula]|uniref:zinc finger protein 74-like isoform X2 n=1 Tax=Polyodon spathula TaxID=7913 RepID=UPI001B7E94B5|nr:zinc finger protein 74-like isoform X2 [Polyodon spathula]